MPCRLAASRLTRRLMVPPGQKRAAVHTSMMHWTNLMPMVGWWLTLITLQMRKTFSSPHRWPGLSNLTKYGYGFVLLPNWQHKCSVAEGHSAALLKHFFIYLFFYFISKVGGIRFLYDNLIESLERYKTSSGFGCILAHSMGLGKTLQVISFIDILLRNTEAHTVLAIVPVSNQKAYITLCYQEIYVYVLRSYGVFVFFKLN